jgi:hypothetical protein
MKWTELGRMNFEQFDLFVRIHGGRSWKWTEKSFDSGPVSMMDGETQFVAYRCDNIRLWCRQKARPPVVAGGGFDDENLVLTV